MRYKNFIFLIIILLLPLIAFAEDNQPWRAAPDEPPALVEQPAIDEPPEPTEPPEPPEPPEFYGTEQAEPQAYVPVQASVQEAPIKASSQQGKISLEIKGMDIIDVLKLLSKQAGLNIVAGKNVRGKVTLFLKDVNPWEAFEIILAANELAYEKKGDIITVMTDRDYEVLYGDRFNIRSKVKIIKLRYAKAIEVSKALNQIKTKVGKIVVDEGSNTIIIQDSIEATDAMVRAVTELDLPTETKVYALNYAVAEKLKDKISKAVSKVGVVEMDERTNKLVVIDTPEKIKEIDSLVSEFDERTRQVLIEAKIVQIALTDEYKFGVNWDSFFNGISLKLGASFKDFAQTGVSAPVLPTTTGGSGGVFALGNLDSHDYQITMKALETLGKTNILSSPRIMAANNQEAKILVGTNQPYATSTTSIPSTGPQVKSYQITYLDIGVKLYVTPTINKDGFITMKIKPEVSSQTSNYTYGDDDDTVPVVKTSQAETTVMVKDGTTIVIAGLIESRDEEEVNKLPILSDIPLIGELFKSRTKGSPTNPEKTELVIFITPFIMVGDTESKREKDEYGGYIQELETRDQNKKMFRFKDMDKDDLPVMEEAPKDKKMLDQEGALQPSVLTPSEYKELVRNKVHNIVNEKVDPTLRGEVYVEFNLLDDGTLKDEPRILRATNDSLKELVVSSVKSASPFPAIPADSSLENRTFKIYISYQ